MTSSAQASARDDFVEQPVDGREVVSEADFSATRKLEVYAAMLDATSLFRSVNINTLRNSQCQ